MLNPGIRLGKMVQCRSQVQSCLTIYSLLVLFSLLESQKKKWEEEQLKSISPVQTAPSRNDAVICTDPSATTIYNCKPTVNVLLPVTKAGNRARKCASDRFNGPSGSQAGNITLTQFNGGLTSTDRSR